MADSAQRIERVKWFNQARFGIFIHWGPYAAIGRGEQVLIREMLIPADYERAACAWHPMEFDPVKWAQVARGAGMKYAVLTTRHHDGYCLWDSTHTDYNSVAQAPKRDFVREYVEAFRAAGLRVGLYYSLADFRIPAYFEGPAINPTGWDAFRDYVHAQVHELLTQYGKIDLFWFDGAWPRTSTEWGAADLLAMMRSLQPDILVNNRLDSVAAPSTQPENAGSSGVLGDFGTPEHRITAEADRPWESCQVSTWRMWGYTRGERWRPSDVLLDMLCEAASKGGNLLLNVGPDAAGALPSPFVDRMRDIGEWLGVNGQAIYGTDRGDITEFVTHGWQTVKGNYLYLICRFWHGNPTLRLYGLGSRVNRAELLGSDARLSIEQTEMDLVISGLPATPPTSLFPVIKLECETPPEAANSALARDRLWTGDPTRYAVWARQRGHSVNAHR